MPSDDPTAPKPWYQSKTVWLNAVLTVIGAGTFLAEPKNDPALTVPSISAAVVGIANVVLRVWFTGAPVQGTRLAAAALDMRARAVGKAVLETTTRLRGETP